MIPFLHETHRSAATIKNRNPTLLDGMAQRKSGIHIKCTTSKFFINIVGAKTSIGDFICARNLEFEDQFLAKNHVRLVKKRIGKDNRLAMAGSVWGEKLD